MNNQQKQYIIIIAIIILSAPMALNFILSIPAFTPIIGKSTDWLVFWGSYLSAAVAFIVLHVQRIDNQKENEHNRKENERLNKENRNLQLNILKHQQEMQWLNMFREASVEYVSAYNYNDLVHSINVMRENPKEAFNILGSLLDRLGKCDTNLKYINIRGKNKQKLYNICDSFFILYNDVIDDVQQMMAYIINTKNLSFEGFFIESTNMQITDDMKIIINSIAIQKNLNMAQQFNDVAISRIKIIEDRSFKIREVFASYIAMEEKRINDILTENI